MPANRRKFLRQASAVAGVAGIGSVLPPVLQQALAIEPQRNTGTLQDVAHIVVLTQENRSFDHYFGSLRGVRGFGDRFAIPVAGLSTDKPRQVWQQPNPATNAQHQVLPFHLDTQANFGLMRAEGTAHTWIDAQQAWDHGRMGGWTQAKAAHSMGYYQRADLPFHYQLADAFTICDAYHCSFMGGTDPNRLFLWTGSNDPEGQGHGPAIYNDLDSLKAQPEIPFYSWTTYPERLQAAGIRWQIYQDMEDNYDDNPLVGFQAYRDAYAGRPGSDPDLKARALSTRTLAQLRLDVLANQLPQVSWIIAGERDSEHPENSSPAQGAHYAARVIEALSANPEVWNKTVLFWHFDENDGFFDHMPPPAAPSRGESEMGDPVHHGDSTVKTDGEYHQHLPGHHTRAQEQQMLGRVYGLGPRVPMLVISPWSRGGWVCSQVFDHTSVIRFMEQRFGVMEPNISAWRRAVCGDLTSALDFSRPDHSALPALPATQALADRARALPQRQLPQAPAVPLWPRQAAGTRPARALPYQLQVHSHAQLAAQTLTLNFVNSGIAGAVFHVYDRLSLERIPRRYTVEAGKQLDGSWALSQQAGHYDLWVLGPNGFHRHFTGQLPAKAESRAALPEVELGYEPGQGQLVLKLSNRGVLACSFELQSTVYGEAKPIHHWLAAGAEQVLKLPVQAHAHWYDLTLRVPELPAFSRRLAGHMETGEASLSDPALGRIPSRAGAMA